MAIVYFKVIIIYAELINMYWEVGEYLSSLVAKSYFGDKVINELASYIAKNNPNIKGFNRRGLYRNVSKTKKSITHITALIISKTPKIFRSFSRGPASAIRQPDPAVLGALPFFVRTLSCAVRAWCILIRKNCSAMTAIMNSHPLSTALSQWVL